MLRAEEPQDVPIITGLDLGTVTCRKFVVLFLSLAVMLLTDNQVRASDDDWRSLTRSV